jgi:hypothetical protein
MTIQNQKESLFVVHWKSKITGFCGNSSPLSKEIAEDSIKYAREEHGGDIFYWLEEHTGEES